MIISAEVLKRIEKFLAGFSWDIGVDLGSSNTMIYLRERGIIVNEPTLVARLKRKRWTGLGAPKMGMRKVVAYGDKAMEMRDREPKQLEVVSPIKNGVIADLEAVENLVAYYLRLVYEVPSKYVKIFKPRIVVGVPSESTGVQRRAVREVFLKAGAREVLVFEQAVLAAMGLGLPIAGGTGLVLLDIGGGKTEISVVTGGGVVVSRSLKLGGIDFDEAIINFLRMKYGLAVGIGSAEKLKMEVGDVSETYENEPVGVIRGKDLGTGLPKSVKIRASEIREAVGMLLGKIQKAVESVINETPPELMDDILKRGVMMVGNGCRLKGLNSFLEKTTKITFNIVDEPGIMVILGIGELVEDSNRLKWLLEVSG